MQINKLNSRNIGDVWGETRVDDPTSVAIIQAVAMRGISGLARDEAALIPRAGMNAGHLAHIADLLHPGDPNAQGQFIRERLIPVDLPIGDTNSEDFAEALRSDHEAREKIQGLNLQPYVDGPRAARFAAEFGLDYDEDNRCNPILESLKNKSNFHKFCLDAGVGSIPHTKIACREMAGLEERSQDLYKVITNIFETARCPHGIMMRHAMSGGGIGNAVIKKMNLNRYHVSTGDNEKIIREEELMSWIEEYHGDNTSEVVVAPFYKGTSVSGVVRVRDGEIQVPYIAEELLNESGTGFQGTSVDPPSLPQRLVEQAKEVLSKIGKHAMNQGLEDGTIQIDMRYVDDMGQLYPVESNAMRSTAVTEMTRFMVHRTLRRPLDGDWISEAAADFERDALDGYIGVDHLRVSAQFNDRVKKVGFQTAFQEVRVLDRKVIAKALGAERARAILGDLDHLDLGIALHSTIPPHTLEGSPRIGLVVGSTPMREPLNGNPSESKETLKRVSLRERFLLANEIF